MGNFYERTGLSERKLATYDRPLNEGFSLKRRAGGLALEFLSRDLAKVAAKHEGLIKVQRPASPERETGVTSIALIKRTEILQAGRTAMLAGITVGDAIETLLEDIPVLLADRELSFTTTYERVDETSDITYISIEPGSEGQELLQERRKAWRTLNSLVEEERDAPGRNFLRWANYVPNLHIVQIHNKAPDTAFELVRAAIAKNLPLDVELAPALKDPWATD